MKKKLINEVHCKTIFFRLAEVQDAEFITNLRLDENFNRYLSTVSHSISDQVKWLEKYKLREINGNELYYIIYKIDIGIPIGCVRLYDFQSDKKSFCWGSWILNENKGNTSALESAYLVYKIAFELLGFEFSHFEVMKGNDKVIDFHNKTGAELVSEDDNSFYFLYSKISHSQFVKKYKKFLF